MQFYESDDIPFPRVNEATTIPDYVDITKFEKIMEVFDVGGSFECLANCIRHAVTKKGDYIHSTKSLYTYLGVPMGEYLEDDSLSKLCHLYSVNALVVRVSEGMPDWMILYDFGYKKTVPMLNTFPSHFQLIEKLILNGNPIVDHFEFNAEYYTPENFTLSEFEPEMPMLVTKPLFSTPIITEDLGILYSYFVDSADMIFPDLDYLLENFYHTHNIFVRALQSVNREKLCPHSDLLSAYYKFRHNTFATMCKFYLEGSMSKLDTDVPLSKYLPTSNKTPDLIVEKDDEIIIYEFTVGNSYERVDYIKGGGNMPLKYEDEARQIQILNKKKCKVQLLAAVLDSYNVAELCDTMTIPVSLEIEKFFEVCNSNKWIISSNFVKSQTYKAENVPKFPGFELFERPVDQQILLFPHDVLSALSTEYTSVFSKLEQVMNMKKKILICFNIDSCKYFFKWDSGKTPNDWYSILGISFTTLLPFIKFHKNGKVIKFHEIRGTVPVSVDKKEREYFLDNWDSYPSHENTYSRSVPEQTPGYDNLTLFDVSNLYSASDQSKVIFPPDYFHKLCSFPVQDMLQCKDRAMLYNCTMCEDEIETALCVFRDGMRQANKLDTIRSKQTFILGFPSVPLTKAEGGTNKDIMSAYRTSGHGLYTKEVLRKASLGLYAFTRKNELNTDVRLAYEKYHEKNANYYKEVLSDGLRVKYSSMSVDDKAKYRPLYLDLKKTRKQYQALLSKGKKVLSDRLVRVKCSGKSSDASHFQNEMKHYNRSEGVSGVGVLEDDTSVHKYFTNLVDRMLVTDFQSEKYRSFYYTERSPGSDFLTSLKDEYTERWNSFYDKNIGGTMLLQMCIFYERLSKFLFNESLKTYGHDYVKIDNLGFSEILVLCRGGAKLYKNQRSRLYKLFFPIDMLDLKFGGYLENDSYEKIWVGNVRYIVTPWSQMHQDILFDYMFCGERMFNQLFSICSRIDNTLTLPIQPLAALPVLFMFHNRRKTEQFLHNSRYLIVNPLGTSANLTGIMSSFVDVNKTYLDAWLRDRLQHHYGNFAQNMLKMRDCRGKHVDNILDDLEMKDLWLGSSLANADLLTLFIYSTYMMTKAPVVSSIEQAKNLWEILQDVSQFNNNHADVVGLQDESLRFSVLNFDIECYKDDFKYDPVFCQYLGFYMGNYLSPNLQMNELTNKWSDIMSSDIDTVANSKGLRGFNKKNFFNHKGYDVVYQKIDSLLDSDDILNRIENYLSCDDLTSSKMIKDDRISFASFDANYDELVFHIVHKIQRGGSREIFCMDLNTKVLQSPIEKMMAHLCKKVPNEFISIPSGKRHSLIHRDFYERKVSPWVKHIVRWVLDCRRWAPHSVFQKYIHFIHGMSNILPTGFIDHFHKFSEGMMKKQFVVRQHVIDKMKNNERFKPYQKHIKNFDKAANAISLSVSFSFVMGIFNYLSTLMHAANQLVASEVIRNRCLTENKGLVILDPKCHSDDSVVTSYHENVESKELSVKLYDWLLKAGNHMLSVKKSQINDDIYVEFLSTLYLLDRFLPVFPKFTSTIPFKPTDEGLLSDLSFAASQAIEMMSMGGSLEESFLLLKTTEKAIWGIYNLEPIKGMPPQFFGSMDAHPIELLFAGASADLYNMYIYNPDKFWPIYNVLVKTKLIDPSKSSLGFSWDMSAYLDRRIEKSVKPLEKALLKVNQAAWTVKNCKLGNSTLNLIWYYLKMRDRKFRSSLVDEPVARRMSRIFGAGGYRRIQDCVGNLIPVAKIVAILTAAVTDNDNTISLRVENYLDFMSASLRDFHSSLLGTEIISNDPTNLKDKPITLTIDSTMIGTGKISASDYVSYVKEPMGYKMLGKFKNPVREVEQVSQELKILGVDVDLLAPEMLYEVARKFLSLGTRIFRVISPVPTGLKHFNCYSNYLTYLECSSYSHRVLRVKNKSAAVADWSKKMVAGKIPNTAVEYMKTYWLCSILQDHNVLDKDIYLEDLVSKERDLANELSDEWKMVLLTSIQQQDLPLSDINHWIYWEKEQIKMGRNWVGSGVCIVKLPEAVFRISVANGCCEHIAIHTEHMGQFSQSSSWFLHNVLTLNSVSANFFDPSLGAPNQDYLGVTQNSVTYGVGKPMLFDMLLEVEWLDTPPYPVSFNSKMPHSKVRSHYIYHGEKDYYIDFFVPVNDPVAISFKGIFSIEKLREHAEDEDVVAFIKKVSIDSGGYMDIKFDHFLDNIGCSTLYNIVFDSKLRVKCISDSLPANSLIEAFSNWKIYHPEFGYPDEKQLDRLLKDSDSAPFPQIVMEYLLKIGKSNITEQEFSAIMTKLATLQGDDQIQFLTNNFSYLDASMQADTLVLTSKSTLIYDCCMFIGDGAIGLLVSFLSVVEKVIDKAGLNAPILNAVCKDLYYAKRVKVSAGKVFKMAFVKLLYECLPARVNPNYLDSYGFVFSALKQLLEVGLGSQLDIHPMSDPILKAVKFTVNSGKILDWFTDLVENFAGYNYRYVIKRNTKALLDKETKATPALSSVAAVMLRFKSLDILDKLEIIFKNSKVTLKRAEETFWGVTTDDFRPLTEEGQEEYQDGYLIDEDVLDDCEEDEDPDIPKYALVNIHQATFPQLTKCRGTAWNVFYKCSSLGAGVRKVKGIVKVFKRKQWFSNLQNYFDNKSGYIVYVGVENVHCRITGYNELSFEQINRELKPKITYSRCMVVEGKKYVRSDFDGNLALQDKVYSMDHYFKQIKANKVEETVGKLEKPLNVYHASGQNKEVEKELRRLLGLMGKQEEQGEEVEAVDFLKFYSQYMEQVSALKVTGGTGIKAFLRANYSMFNFSETLSVLTDLVVRSEIECVIPGYWNRLLNGEVKISLKTKERFMRYAVMSIKEMPKILRKKYNKLLYLVKFILSCTKTCNFRENETLEFISILDDLFTIDESASSSEDDINDLLPDGLEDHIKLDLSKIL